MNEKTKILKSQARHRKILYVVREVTEKGSKARDPVRPEVFAEITSSLNSYARHFLHPSAQKTPMGRGAQPD
jgi:hypothetical protein